MSALRLFIPKATFALIDDLFFLTRTAVNHSLRTGKGLLFVLAQCLSQRKSGDGIYLRLRFLRPGDHSWEAFPMLGGQKRVISDGGRHISWWTQEFSCSRSWSQSDHPCNWSRGKHASVLVCVGQEYYRVALWSSATGYPKQVAYLSPHTEACLARSGNRRRSEDTMALENETRSFEIGMSACK